MGLIGALVLGESDIAIDAEHRPLVALELDSCLVETVAKLLEELDQRLSDFGFVKRLVVVEPFPVLVECDGFEETERFGRESCEFGHLLPRTINAFSDLTERSGEGNIRRTPSTRCPCSIEPRSGTTPRLTGIARSGTCHAAPAPESPGPEANASLSRWCRGRAAERMEPAATTAAPTHTAGTSPSTKACGEA